MLPLPMFDAIIGIVHGDDPLRELCCGDLTLPLDRHCGYFFLLLQLHFTMRLFLLLNFSGKAHGILVLYLHIVYTWGIIK